jgi:hypothetical protein
VFRRRRQTDDLEDDFEDVEVDDADEAHGAAPAETHSEYGANVDYPLAEATTSPSAHEPTTGPWDFRDKPRDDDVPRVDLGGMRIPIPDGVELRVEAQEDVIVAAVLIDRESQILLNAFAAPKSAGIWADVRAEIVEALSQSGGSAKETTTSLGVELQAQIPAETGGLQPARFIGVDGPRWFLRGLITGEAASTPSAAAVLEQAFLAVVVNRGTEAMAPRDAIPLHLPREILDGTAEQIAAADADETPAESAAEPEPEERTFELRERGPEITETR